MTVDEDIIRMAVTILDGIDPESGDGGDVEFEYPGPGGAHQWADRILLDVVDERVADAYRRLIDRASWWAPS